MVIILAYSIALVTEFLNDNQGCSIQVNNTKQIYELYLGPAVSLKDSLT